MVDNLGRQMVEKKDETKFKYSFTTFEGGQYTLCIHNTSGNDNARIHLQMKNGVAAKDYSEIAKKKDLKPMELNVNIT